MLITVTVYRKIIFAVIACVPFVFYTIKHLTGYQFKYSYAINNSLFVVVVLYCFIIIVYYLKKLNDHRKKRIIVTFLIVALVFFPLIIADIILLQTTIQLPIYLIIVNILSILFSFFYLAPPSPVAGEQIADILQKKYNITNREKEIIGLIQKGYSNNEISSMISISISTVEKHINSVYKKLNIKKRVQLVNLLQSDIK